MGVPRNAFWNPVSLIARKSSNWGFRAAGRGANLGSRAVGDVVVPGADLLADVAPEDVRAHRSAEFFRNRASELDGQVGNAAPRVHHAGRDDGVRRAIVDTPRARAAMLLKEGRVRLQRPVQ